MKWINKIKTWFKKTPWKILTAYGIFYTFLGAVSINLLLVLITAGIFWFVVTFFSIAAAILWSVYTLMSRNIES